VLTKVQYVIMDFWVMDDAKILNILLDGKGLGSHERVDKFRCANGHAHAFQSRYIDDAKLINAGFGKVPVIEFTEALKRGVLIDLPEHKFASSLSGDTRDVNLNFGHVETQFRVLSKPLANLDQHLEGCLESGINVRIISYNVESVSRFVVQNPQFVTRFVVSRNKLNPFPNPMAISRS
jgi:hypothetical protein